jgi:hypothetical protein
MTDVRTLGQRRGAKSRLGIRRRLVLKLGVQPLDLVLEIRNLLVENA